MQAFELCRRLKNSRESKTVLDSGFHVVDSRLQVLYFSICQWNLDSGLQSLVGFRIPKSGIPDSILSKIFPVSGFPYTWVNLFKQNRMKANPENTRLFCGETIIPI